MNTLNQHVGMRPKLMVLAILAAFGTAYADDDIAQYIKPDDASASVGAGYVDGDRKDRALFGQYNGMRKSNVYGLLDVDYISRNDDTGVWNILKVRNLGLDTRELSYTWQRQGDWKVSVDYDSLVRINPRTVNTGMTDPGSAMPTVRALTTPGSGTDIDLKTKRASAGLGFEKSISKSLQFEFAVKHEEKDGSRLFGRGLNCSSSATANIPCPPANSGALLLLPEPINFTTRQVDARLNYSGEKFLLSGAYYGAFFTNENGTLRPTISGNLYNPNGTVINMATAPGTRLGTYMTQPLGLPPDSQAHQFSLSGHYAFTPRTRANFKYSYTRATQDEDFAAMGYTTMPAGVTNLGGRLDTMLFQLGITARPLDKLSLSANARYEDRDNKTSVAFYSPTAGRTNVQNSLKKLSGKVEASYRFAPNYRATLGIDYEEVNHGVPVSTYGPGGLTLLREETRETSYRLELRRSLSETVNGVISYVHSKRNGSDWLQATLGTPVVSETAAAALGNNRPVTPTMFMNRERDKIKLSVDWSPTDRLSFQFFAEDAKDKYDAPSNGVRKGLKDTGGKLYGIDAAFAISDAWKLNAYWTQSEQTQHINHSLYMAELEGRNDAFGLGVTGKPSEKFEIGGDLSYANDKNGYWQGLETMSNTAMTIATNTAFLAAQGGLPDVVFRSTTLKLFGKYALNKRSSLRFDLIHSKAKLNEWTWSYAGVPFFYSDNTTVTMRPEQKTTFVGVSYVYKF